MALSGQFLSNCRAKLYGYHVYSIQQTAIDNLANQIRAAAAYGDIKIDLPEAYVHYEDNKKPQFLSKFPHGKIPAFEDKDGFKLFESIAIARYSESSFPLILYRQVPSILSQRKMKHY